MTARSGDDRRKWALGRIRIVPRARRHLGGRQPSSKIDHIVVVMMENRSYDHVLGYRATQAINEQPDGADED